MLVFLVYGVGGYSMGKVVLIWFFMVDVRIVLVWRIVGVLVFLVVYLFEFWMWFEIILMWWKDFVVLVFVKILWLFCINVVLFLDVNENN